MIAFGGLTSNLFDVSHTHMKMLTKRPYTMGRRGEQVREAGARILETVRRDFLLRYVDDVTLDEVAAAAGVTVQTLLRRYGSKEGLFTAAAELLHRDFLASRGQVAPGDVAMAVRMIVQGYERNGDTVLRGLFQEERVAAIGSLVERGRRSHQEWISRVFEPWLVATKRRDRVRLHAQLVAILDVFTWKLFRRDLGLSIGETETAMRELVESLLRRAPRAARGENPR
jgi:AcrR family transcriptional regulator